MNKANKSAIIIEIVIFIAAGLLLLLYFYADNRILTMEDQEGREAMLVRHYAFVSQDDSDLWRAVYAAAHTQAELSSDYMEWIGEDSPVSYGIEDKLRIAAASGVDEIILHQSADDDLTELIDGAWEKGIPVVMALEDDPESSRISYVGVNNYQMGENYAEQVLKCLKDGLNRVQVLSGGSIGEGGPALMYNRMTQVIEQNREEGQHVAIDVLEIDSRSSFETEEAIRDLFLGGSAIPDILVCLDPVTTECVAQALVDYNEVGNVSVIGFYASDAVQEEVERGIIHSALGIDAKQMGEVLVNALNEYREQGRVSDYFNVGLFVLDSESEAS